MFKKILLLFLFLNMSLTFAARKKTARPSGIDWFGGTVEEAFSVAKKESKPLFLYWGAIWCPPCNQMKKTIFASAEFKKEIEHFIAVYLDGDENRAQKWGTKLNASGYPTMIILNPEGKEILRLPTGVSSKKYVNLMKSARSSLEPVGSILKRALTGKGSKKDWEILSTVSWYKSEHIKKGKEKEFFEKLYKLSVKEAESIRSKVFLLMANYTDEKELQKFKGDFVKFLKSKNFYKDNLEMLTWSGPSILPKFFTGVDLKNWTNIYLQEMRKFRKDTLLSLDERLSTYYPEIILQKDKISKKLKDEVISEVEKVSKAAKDYYTRQSVMSTAVYLLMKIENYELAYDYAKRELKKSISPFYFMNYLASIDEKLNRHKEALKWRLKAWESASGDATKFQWGSKYLKKLISLDSKNVDEFKEKSKIIFTRLFSQEDAFSGRNQRGLESFKKAFKKWDLSEKIKKNFEKYCNSAHSSILEKCKKWSQSL